MKECGTLDKWQVSIGCPCACFAYGISNQSLGATNMSKGRDTKKQEKKKPLKTLMEKRAAKRAKRADKGFSIVVK